jgi:hypothetical protein
LCEGKEKIERDGDGLKKMKLLFMRKVILGFVGDYLER